MWTIDELNGDIALKTCEDEYFAYLSKSTSLAPLAHSIENAWNHG